MFAPHEEGNAVANNESAMRRRLKPQTTVIENALAASAKKLFAGA